MTNGEINQNIGNEAENRHHDITDLNSDENNAGSHFKYLDIVADNDAVVRDVLSYDHDYQVLEIVDIKQI